MTPNGAASGRAYRVTIDGRVRTVVMATADGAPFAILDGERVPVSWAGGPAGGRALLVGTESWDVGVEAERDGWAVTVGGRTYAVEVIDEALARLRRTAVRAAGPARETIRAPMPGLVVAVPVRQGDAVAKGTPVVVLEAMKMQNELTTRAAGTVERVAVAVGDKVEKDALLVVVSP